MIYNVLPVNNYSGNNLNTKFDFDFYIENEKQLKVNLFDENDTKIELRYNLDYSINEFKNENGSYIIFPLETSLYSVLDERQKISLELNLPIIQQTRYNNSSLLNLSSLEYSFDYLTRLVQILARKLDLTVRVEECSTVSPNELLENINDSKLVCTQKASIAVDSANFAAEIKEYLNDTKSLLLDNKNITNCITELPQNIKFDLADGILTLKAGSTVIFPNGFEEDGVTPKFDYVTIESDNQLDLKNIPARSFLFWTPSTQVFNYRPIETVYSGSSDPATIATTYYQINNNIVVSHNLSGDINVTLPILIFNSDGANVSIDQVFNGIGYIGSTIWVDKGIKGLIPNGRNEDGSLKNKEFATEKLLMHDVGNWSTASNAVYGQLMSIYSSVANYDFAFQPENRFYTALATPVNVNTTNYAYIEEENQWYLWYGSSIKWVKADIQFFGTLGYSNGITSFSSKQPFRALDYNDKPEISGWAMPSDKYIDLTIGATSAIYVAPANGFINVIINSANGYVYVNCFDSDSVYCYSSTESNGTSTTGARVLCPIRKGHKYQVGYSGTVSQFRFIYAQGEV